MDKKSESGNRKIVGKVKEGGESGDQMKLEHLPEQHGVRTQTPEREAERAGKGFCLAVD